MELMKLIKNKLGLGPSNLLGIRKLLTKRNYTTEELVKLIKDRFWKKPSDLAGIRKLLSKRKFTAEELAELAIDFTNDCFCEYHTALDPEEKSVTLENMHSNHIVNAIHLLLEFGLNPNISIDGENAMWSAMYIDAPNVAASVMRLLLEKGGNPNHTTPEDDETLFSYIAFKVSYDQFTHEDFHTVQCWLLLMAYGGCFWNGEIPITMLGNNSVEIFKEFEQYDYLIEPLPPVPGYYGCWRMHIFNKTTKEIVAVYK